MEMLIPPVGREGRHQRVVTADVTAHAVGNTGVQVLSTPHTVLFVEIASGDAMTPYLTEGEATVGTRMEINHRGAAALGTVVTTTVRLIAVEGRRYTFDFVVETADGRRLADGTYESFRVDLDRFLSKATGQTS